MNRHAHSGPLIKQNEHLEYLIHSLTLLPLNKLTLLTRSRLRLTPKYTKLKYQNSQEAGLSRKPGLIIQLSYWSLGKALKEQQPSCSKSHEETSQAAETLILQTLPMNKKTEDTEALPGASSTLDSQGNVKATLAGTRPLSGSILR